MTPPERTVCPGCREQIRAELRVKAERLRQVARVQRRLRPHNAEVAERQAQHAEWAAGVVGRGA